VQALSGAYLMQHGRELEPRVHTLPAEIDEEIARLKLETLGVRIDELTAPQKAFLQAWEAFG
jgi:adenosylhomocysteinase